MLLFMSFATLHLTFVSSKQHGFFFRQFPTRSKLVYMEKCSVRIDNFESLSSPVAIALLLDGMTIYFSRVRLLFAKTVVYVFTCIFACSLSAEVVNTADLEKNKASLVDPECLGFSDAVSILVNEKSKDSYVYSVHNKYKSNLIRIVLGDGYSMEMPIVAFQQPLIVGSPESWIAHVVYKEESIYMVIYWAARENVAGIKPNHVADKFTVEAPKLAKILAPLYGLDGTLTIPVDFKKLPFLAYFADGTCVWGRVKT